LGFIGMIHLIAHLHGFIHRLRCKSVEVRFISISIPLLSCPLAPCLFSCIRSVVLVICWQDFVSKGILVSEFAPMLIFTCFIFSFKPSFLKALRSSVCTQLVFSINLGFYPVAIQSTSSSVQFRYSCFSSSHRWSLIYLNKFFYRFSTFISTILEIDYQS